MLIEIIFLQSLAYVYEFTNIWYELMDILPRTRVKYIFGKNSIVIEGLISRRLRERSFLIPVGGDPNKGGRETFWPPRRGGAKHFSAPRRGARGDFWGARNILGDFGAISRGARNILAPPEGGRETF